MKWTPTLFRVDQNAVRMWTGPALALRMIGHLGLRSTVKVLQAIASDPTAESRYANAGPRTGTTRRRFLEIAAGALAVGGILVTGASPSAADPVETWIRSHRGELPRTYPEIEALPLAYRMAVYGEWTPAERSAAWVAHLTAARKAFKHVSEEQAAILEQAMNLAADPSIFEDESPVPSDAAVLASRGIVAFGIDEARAIFATLGPTNTLSVAAVTCECSTASDYCGGRCRGGGCMTSTRGCGFLYLYSCNGRCGP